MSTIHNTVATLRFFGDDLDPGEITSLLGASPTVGVRKGGVWLTSGGTEKVARRGSWRLNVDDRSPGDLDAQIAELFVSLTNDLTIWNALTSRFDANIFLGLFLHESNEGISLAPETLKSVGSRGLLLDFDIYGAVADD
jgi:hypothetical protein